MSWAFLVSDATVRARNMWTRHRARGDVRWGSHRNPANLSRDRQIDVCAQCHGGLGEEIAPAFSFKPGEPLANFITLQRLPPDAIVDVHGNQVALLERSRCFQSSCTCRVRPATMSMHRNESQQVIQAGASHAMSPKNAGCTRSWARRSSATALIATCPYRIECHRFRRERN